jgi:LuxR family maltose regulon positive regulatory protein
MYEPVFAALEADFQMKHGNLVAAEQWLAAANISPATPLTPIYEFVFLIYTRLLLNLNQPQPAQALELLARVETVVGQGGRDRMLLITLVQQALAYAALQQTEQALACLEKALALAAPEGYIFPFLDEGPAVAVLLPKLHHVAPAFVAELLQAFATQPNGKAREPKRDVSSATLSALIEPLSDRELELLQLVTGGRSNKEIAESLFITVGTVKKHLNNIFGKLNTKNRTEAVARARELGLVD